MSDHRLPAPSAAPLPRVDPPAAESVAQDRLTEKSPDTGNSPDGVIPHRQTRPSPVAVTEHDVAVASAVQRQHRGKTPPRGPLTVGDGSAPARLPVATFDAAWPHIKAMFDADHVALAEALLKLVVNPNVNAALKIHAFRELQHQAGTDGMAFLIDTCADHPTRLALMGTDWHMDLPQEALQRTTAPPGRG
ncbi:hypothetical protein [Pandoraea sputorum]|uniref:Uncharacterized protein n=1 Tax=Pandoraea sputorum TaxID=93222 RepID=A0A5E5BJ67_9BURK|nr:hypothetical protein [Pandoraea sputorum]VVE85095.1 hypothetical protein PSP31121_05086 [Pandoraea sputorum]